MLTPKIWIGPYLNVINLGNEMLCVLAEEDVSTVQHKSGKDFQWHGGEKKFTGLQKEMSAWIFKKKKTEEERKKWVCKKFLKCTGNAFSAGRFLCASYFPSVLITFPMLSISIVHPDLEFYYPLSWVLGNIILVYVVNHESEYMYVIKYICLYVLKKSKTGIWV